MTETREYGSWEPEWVTRAVPDCWYLIPEEARDWINGLANEVDRLTALSAPVVRDARRCNAIGHPTVTPESLIPCQLDRGHEGDHYSTSGCSGGAVSWPTVEAQLRDARAERDEQRALYEAISVEWADAAQALGTAQAEIERQAERTGYWMRHAQQMTGACRGVADERDELHAELAVARAGNERLREAQRRDGEAAARCFQRNHDELEAENEALRLRVSLKADTEAENAGLTAQIAAVEAERDEWKRKAGVFRAEVARLRDAVVSVRQLERREHAELAAERAKTERVSMWCDEAEAEAEIWSLTGMLFLVREVRASLTGGGGKR